MQKTSVEAIAGAARALLEDPGVMLEDDEVVARMLAAGARPGGKPQVVRLPASMLDDCLARAPRRFHLADRKGGRREVGPDTPSLFWTGAALFILDGGKNAPGAPVTRPIRRADLADFARVIDALPNVHGIVGTALDDAPPTDRDYAGLRVMARATGKHLRALSFTPRGGEAMLEMGRVLAGSAGLKANPVFSLGFTAHGPLRWTSLALGVFKSTAGHGVPVTVNGEPMAGASAPVTLAGTAAVGTAEILAGIAVNQVLEPGRPCFFNLGFSHVMDMRTGFAVTGGVENCLLAVTGAELARYFGLPSVSWMCSDSLLADGQNAVEKGFAAITHASARVSVVWGVGQLESEKTLSMVQAVIDDEIAGAAMRYAAGFAVDDSTLAVEEVRKAGIAGSFLGTEHTLEHFRGTVWEPKFFVRAPGRSLLSEPEEKELAKIETRYSGYR